MTTRIGTFGANQQYISQLFDIQSRVNDEQTQVSTGLKSTTFTGLSQQANSILTMQTQKAASQQYITDNNLTTTKLSAASTTLDSIRTTISNFSKALTLYAEGNTKDQGSVENIQSLAFNSMLDLQSYLSANVGGDYLFSGGRVSTSPVQLPASTLNEFQQMFDGAKGTYPTTRATDLLDLSLSSTQTGAVTYDAAASTITAATANAFSGVGVGSRVTIAGLVPSTPVTVTSNTGTKIGISRLVSESTSGATISFPGSSVASLTSSTTGALTFSPGSDTITAAGTLPTGTLAVGTTFKVTGTTNNDGLYTVKANTGNTITIESARLDLVAPTTTEQAASLTDGTNTTTKNTGGTGNAGYGTLTFAANSSGQPTITAATTGAFASEYSPGDTITVSGATDSANNGTFYVQANSGTTLTLSRTVLPDVIAATTTEQASSITDNGTNTTTKNTGGNGGAGYGTLTFATNASNQPTLAAATAGAFTGLYAKGTTITVSSSTDPANNGTYLVLDNDNTTLTLSRQQPTAANTFSTSTGTFTASSWYKGDTLAVQQQVDTDRNITTGVYASDPAFEKAIRAMAIIAQGAFGTAGGLDQNTGRIADAQYLLQDSLQHTNTGTPPYGSELTSDLDTLQAKIGYNQNVVKTKTDTETQFVGFLQTRLASTMNMDPSEAITNLLADNRALQASYQALGQVWSLSLLNYLK